MSILITNTSIQYGDKTTILINDLSNITITPENSVIDILPSGNNFIAIVNPKISTLYNIVGYDIFKNQYNLSGTVYVNVTVDTDIVNVNYNSSLQLNAFGCESYTWYPSTYLDQTTGSSVIVTPLEDIIYTITGTDIFSTISQTKIKVIVNTNLVFVPSNPTVYDGNLLNLSVSYNQSNVNQNDLIYSWKSKLFDGLPPNCIHYKYGKTITLHPYNNEEYTVTVSDNLSNNNTLTSGKIYITVVPKPSHVIDVDVLPYKLYTLILQRRKKELLRELAIDKILSRKIIFFYYNVLQTSYRMEWNDRNGIPYKINWTTLYQKINKSNEMKITFKQQWEFFQYINFNQRRGNYVKSNFAFLLNCVNQIYLEHPQKIYLT